MRDLLLLAIHLIVTLARFLRPGGARAVAAESLLLKPVTGSSRAGQDTEEYNRQALALVGNCT